MFFQNLELESIELEHDESLAFDQYVKVHLPYKVLIRYSEILKYKMPIRDKYLTDMPQIDDGKDNFWRGISKSIMKPFKCVELQTQLRPGTEKKIYHEFSRDKEYL